MTDDNSKPSKPTDPILNTDSKSEETWPVIVAFAIVAPLTYFSWWFARGVVLGDWSINF